MPRRAKPLLLPGGRLAVSVRNEQPVFRPSRRLIERIARIVAAGESPGKGGEITILLVTDPVIRRLNKRFHHSDCATDVLAFDQEPAGEFMADLIVSADTAVANAATYHTTPLFETYLYVIHGMLHLTGYRDSTPRLASGMRAKERAYLKKLGISKNV